MWKGGSSGNDPSYINRSVTSICPFPFVKFWRAWFTGRQVPLSLTRFTPSSYSCSSKLFFLLSPSGRSHYLMQAPALDFTAETNKCGPALYEICNDSFMLANPSHWVQKTAQWQKQNEKKDKLGDGVGFFLSRQAESSTLLMLAIIYHLMRLRIIRGCWGNH